MATGMGTVNPLGSTLDEYWGGLIEGRSGARTAELYPNARLTTKFSFSTDLARDACYFRCEGTELVHHRVDGVL